MEFPEPFHLVTKYLPEVNQGAALDIGSGNGANSLFLAKNGFRVEAIDIDGGAIERLSDLARKNELNIRAEIIDVRDFKFSPARYDLILAIQSLVFLRKSEFLNIISSIKFFLKSSGVAIVSSLTTKDDSFIDFSGHSKLVEENTYLDSETNMPWQFLGENELRNHFPEKEFEIIFYDERVVVDEHPEISYPHRHGVAMIVVRKKTDTVY